MTITINRIPDNRATEIEKSAFSRPHLWLPPPEQNLSQKDQSENVVKM